MTWNMFGFHPIYEKYVGLPELKDKELQNME